MFIETMASHGKELTDEQKEIIISLSNNGYSRYRIQDLTNIDSRTIQNFLKECAREETYMKKTSSDVEVKKDNSTGCQVIIQAGYRKQRTDTKDLTSRFNNRT